MSTSTRFIVERRGTGLGWETVAHPRDATDGLQTLAWLRSEESGKRYRGEFRLVRVTREIWSES